MEMPINVMIVLFVALAVAMLVLQLAGQIVSQGQEQIEQFTLGCEENVDFFVETKNISSSTVASLVELCYNEHLGKYEGKKVCYIIHGDFAGDPTTDVNPEHVDTVDISNAGKTIYIKFNEISQLVDITG